MKFVKIIQSRLRRTSSSRVGKYLYLDIVKQSTYPVFENHGSRVRSFKTFICWSRLVGKQQLFVSGVPKNNLFTLILIIYIYISVTSSSRRQRCCFHISPRLWWQKVYIKRSNFHEKISLSIEQQKINISRVQQKVSYLRARKTTNCAVSN